jgi:hypothetical protein|eukprot:jgi/Chrpa1/19932/Chrysochromulina_OHIO_Genome00023122-RA
MMSPSAEATFSTRYEGQDPANLVGIFTVDKGPHQGMIMKAFRSRATHLFASVTTFYMHEASRKKFPLHEHYQTPRNTDGLATDCKIRMKEAMLLNGTLICAACNRRPSLGHGTLMFVVDATDEEEPSWTALRQHDFHLDKIDRDAAQILCVCCEKKKTCQAEPGAQGSARPRREPVHVVRVGVVSGVSLSFDEDDE